MRFGGPVFVPVRPRLMLPLSGPARSFRSGRSGVRRRIEWSIGADGAAASVYRSVDGGRSGMPSGACRPSLFVSVAGARACNGAVVPVRLRIFDVVGRRPSEESFFCRGDGTAALPAALPIRKEPSAERVFETGRRGRPASWRFRMSSRSGRRRVRAGSERFFVASAAFRSAGTSHRARYFRAEIGRAHV